MMAEQSHKFLYYQNALLFGDCDGGSRSGIKFKEIVLNSIAL